MTISNRVTVTGHTGMLGSTVVKYYKQQGFEVETTNFRWPQQEFKSWILSRKSPIINCMGIIPQSTNTDFSLNHTLPTFLVTNEKRFIQPCTDCVFDGSLQIGGLYDINDIPNATDEYGRSKAKAYEMDNVREFVTFIRASIVGHDKNAQSLLSWFLLQKMCLGYTNHYWNGISTLYWARLSRQILWDKPGHIFIPSTHPVSKYELLKIISRVFEKDIEIIPTVHPKTINKCLKGNLPVGNIEEQLKELREFYENSVS